MEFVSSVLLTTKINRQDGMLVRDSCRRRSLARLPGAEFWTPTVCASVLGDRRYSADADGTSPMSS